MLQISIAERVEKFKNLRTSSARTVNERTSTEQSVDEQTFSERSERNSVEDILALLNRQTLPSVLPEVLPNENVLMNFLADDEIINQIKLSLSESSVFSSERIVIEPSLKRSVYTQNGESFSAPSTVQCGTQCGIQHDDGFKTVQCDTQHDDQSLASKYVQTVPKAVDGVYSQCNIAYNVEKCVQTLQIPRAYAVNNTSARV